MSVEEMSATAKALFRDGKGLLAMDESNPTCNKRFEKLGIPQTEEYRQKWRQLIVTAPGLSESISGAILYDETIWQKSSDDIPFITILQKNGIVPGIKVDAGAKDFAGHPGEKSTEGLDGLRERLTTYFNFGARFAKWRAVITIGPSIPSIACIDANVTELTLYALLCQEAGLVPIVEPEVLMDGDHTMEKCREVTVQVQNALFEKLTEYGVALEALILKPNMILPGLNCQIQETVDETAEATIATLLRTVPAKVPAVAFLSGGQSAEHATARLAAMNTKYGERVPWAVAFSYSRAIQQKALEIWRGEDSNIAEAQRSLIFYASSNRQARLGREAPAVS